MRIALRLVMKLHAENVYLSNWFGRFSKDDCYRILLLSHVSVNPYSTTQVIRFINKRINGYNSDMFWLWLFKEIKFLASDTNVNNIDDDLLIELNKTVFIVVNKTNGSTSDIASDILNLLFHKIGINLNAMDNDSLNFNDVTKYVWLDSNIDYNMVGWILLKREIEKLALKQNGYKYFHDIIRYINSNTSLFKRSIISYLRIIKNESSDEQKEAIIRLKKATETCWEINKLIESNVIGQNENNIANFVSLYNQMKKTKRIKQILQTLQYK
eukprot:433828_1